ncbi:hypothetical protein A9995_14575 [Erythrobacter sp. QSSC1-22B]|nr:hypothetical protein A9995_14575 [Erythrobacter sp. QSSC1-22B]
MNWAHTWLGVALGGVLFAVFWMGSLTVFDSEIDRWMIPETRVAPSEQAVSYDRLLALMPKAAVGSDYVNFVAPEERSRTVTLFYRGADGTFHDFHLDPVTGQEIGVTDSLAGTGFIYPFHHTLTIYWASLGMWIVGFAALAMLILLVSGLYIHRKIIAEFFVFRPRRKTRRATLDLHNLSSLVGLPFYFLITFSGLLTFGFYYLPWGVAEPFGGDTDALYAETAGAFQPGDRTGRPASLASVDAMKQEAESLWSSEEGVKVEANIIRVLNHDDESAVVYFRNTFPKDRVVLSEYVAVFDGASGKLLQNFSLPPIGHASAWVQGAHFMQFDHWPLRWLYFLGGLGGCVMIATGLLFWLKSREGKLAANSIEYRLVEALTIGSVTGIIVATGAFLVANRLLPHDAFFLGEGRAELEVQVFWLSWLAALIHATLLRDRSWKQQCLLIAALAFSAVMLNALTTGDHIFAALAGGQWGVAGMDGILMLAALSAIWSANKLASKTNADNFATLAPVE